MIRSFRADFERICRDDPQQRAILDSKTGRVWTYRSLFESVVGFSSLLWRAGVRPPARVFSILPNSIEQLVAFLATLWSGLDFCPISPLSTAGEAAGFARMSRSTIGLVPDRIRGDLAENLREATIKRLLIPITIDGDLTRYTDQLTGEQEPSAEAGRLFLFTSGTTSNPKAMVLNGDRLWSSAIAWVEFHPLLAADSRFYNILPMSYLGGLFNIGLIPLACHGSTVISDAFSAASIPRFWREVREHSANTLWLAPTMLRILMRLYRRDRDVEVAAAGVRVSLLGMASISLAEKERFEETLGIPLLENFALSETTFLTSEEFKSPLKRETGSVGRVLPWVTLRLRPLDGDPAKLEIEAKTPFLFEGYLGADGVIHRPLTEDGFFRTGDLGEFNEDGVLVLKGRCKDVIKKGGYLVSLRELEEVAEGHPSVREAAAVGTPHEFYGESPVLCVQLAPGTSPLDALRDLRNVLRARLAQFKWPGDVVAVSELPKTESGKVQKWVLANWLASGTNVLKSLSGAANEQEGRS